MHCLKILLNIKLFIVSPKQGWFVTTKFWNLEDRIAQEHSISQMNRAQKKIKVVKLRSAFELNAAK